MSRRFAVQITEAAEVDLQQIIEAVAERASPASAEKLLDDLLERVSTLETFPDRGSVPGELAPLGIKDFRQLVFQTYRVIYRVIGDAVFVLVIADGRQDMQSLLERRLLED